jgi:N-acetylglucosamine repressor
MKICSSSSLSRVFAGETGHMSIQEGGPLCNCGNRGCLESICGIPALVRRAKAELPVIPNDDELKKAWTHKGKISVEDIIESASIKESYSGELLSLYQNHDIIILILVQKSILK